MGYQAMAQQATTDENKLGGRVRRRTQLIHISVALLHFTARSSQSSVEDAAHVVNHAKVVKERTHVRQLGVVRV